MSDTPPVDVPEEPEGDEDDESEHPATYEASA